MGLCFVVSVITVSILQTSTSSHGGLLLPYAL